MFIKELQLINFRGFKKLTVSFSSHFSLIVGNNGSGKSSILEGLTVAAGSFYWVSATRILGIFGLMKCILRQLKMAKKSNFPLLLKLWGALTNRQKHLVFIPFGKPFFKQNRPSFKKLTHIL